jgi:hypothetical protein
LLVDADPQQTAQDWAAVRASAPPFMPRHRAQEFRRFLDTVEKNAPVDLDIHIIMDNVQ